MVIEYDGAQWQGWQTQPDGNTIQDAVERAFSISLGVPVSITGAGRTDAGVHARGQVAHFRTDRSLDLFRILNSVNGILPPTIAIHRIEPSEESFHARFSAISRTYHYHLRGGKSALQPHRDWIVFPFPDRQLMNAAALQLSGRHDFSAFCRSTTRPDARMCTVHSAEWFPGPSEASLVFVIEANRFLHGMVRAIVGTLVEIGQGRRPATDIHTLLETKNRAHAAASAPARGLFLERIRY